MNIEYTIYTIYKQTILESNLHFNISTNNKILTVEIYTMIRLLVPTNILLLKSQHTESTFFVCDQLQTFKNTDIETHDSTFSYLPRSLGFPLYFCPKIFQGNFVKTIFIMLFCDGFKLDFQQRTA